MVSLVAEAAPISPWRRWLGPVGFAVFGLIDILVFGLFAHKGDATFAFFWGVPTGFARYELGSDRWGAELDRRRASS